MKNNLQAHRLSKYIMQKCSNLHSWLDSMIYKPDASGGAFDELICAIFFPWFDLSLRGEFMGISSKVLEMSISSWSVLSMRRHDGTFSQPLGSKIRTSSWDIPLYLNIRKSPTFKSWALTNAFHPDWRTSSLWLLVICALKVPPLRDSSLMVLSNFPLKCFTNASGMVCRNQINTKKSPNQEVEMFLLHQ